MPGLLGKGVLVNWGGVLAASEVDYNAWHSLEHMPERLSVPGFRRGRRCIAVEGTPEHLKYFMMYEAADTEIFISAPYLQRLNDPTPWTQRILSTYVAPSRTVCRVLDSHGYGVGGWLATLQFPQQDAQTLTVDEMLSWAKRVSGMPGILGAHALQGEASLGQQPTTEKKFRESRGEPDRTVALAFLIDGMDRMATQAAIDSIVESLEGDRRQACIATLYQTQHILSDTDVAVGTSR